MQMKLRLQRIVFKSSGILGWLHVDGDLMLRTLEHAFETVGAWAPKVPPGVYNCVRGTHTLKSGDKLETFEITGVPEHSGIIFHWGNFNADSDGCVLLGRYFLKPDLDLPESCATLAQSRLAVNDFMQRLAGVDSFQLEVI